jgi:hypothetical protein
VYARGCAEAVQGRGTIASRSADGCGTRDECGCDDGRAELPRRIRREGSEKGGGVQHTARLRERGGAEIILREVEHQTAAQAHHAPGEMQKQNAQPRRPHRASASHLLSEQPQRIFSLQTNHGGKRNARSVAWHAVRLEDVREVRMSSPEVIRLPQHVARRAARSRRGRGAGTSRRGRRTRCT